MEGFAYVDGEVMPISSATIPMMDRGSLVGDGIFETMRTGGGRIFRLEDHVERFQDGMQHLGFHDDVRKEFRKVASKLVETGNKELGGDLYVRIQATMGSMRTVVDGAGLNINGMVRPFAQHPHRQKIGGIEVAMAKQRKDPLDPLSRIKHMSLMGFMAAARQAQAMGADDALLTNTLSRIAEGTTSNVFALVGDTVHAPGPAEGAIPGITRKVLLELIQEDGRTVNDRLTLDQLARANEVFLTNTTGGVMPVTRIEGAPVGNGQVGDWTMDLQKRLDDLIEAGA